MAEHVRSYITVCPFSVSLHLLSLAGVKPLSPLSHQTIKLQMELWGGMERQNIAHLLLPCSSDSPIGGRVIDWTRSFFKLTGRIAERILGRNPSHSHSSLAGKSSPSCSGACLSFVDPIHPCLPYQKKVTAGCCTLSAACAPSPEHSVSFNKTIP